MSTGKNKDVSSEEKNESQHIRVDGNIIFGLWVYQGKIFFEVPSQYSQITIQNFIRGKISLENLMDTHFWCTYHALIDFKTYKYLRIPYDDSFTIKDNYTYEIDSFWAYAKTRLLKFKGVKKHVIYLHIKECEFRFNHRHEDIYSLVLKILRENPLN